MRIHLAIILALVISLATAACSSTQKESDGVRPGAQDMLLFDVPIANSADSVGKPYLIVVSIDGYRHDYNKLFAPPNLARFASEGVQAESLIPVYPSRTFPNHVSIVTGLRADRHGIVSNEFFDPARGALFSPGDRKAVEDGSWYFGEPIWVTAGRQGMRSATFFWVGSEARIQGGHPNYFYRYDDMVPNERRVDQVLSWLKLPESERPHVILLYFASVDQVSHRHGVNSPELRQAVLAVDAMIGRLQEGLKKTGLPVNVMIVSDHGMADLEPSKVIYLDESVEMARLLAKFQVIGRGPGVSLYLNKGEDPALVGEVEKNLRKRARNFRVWRRDAMDRLGYASHPRVGDLVIETDLPYLVGMRAFPPVTSGANHGWDPKNRLMHGIFFANGPAFREKTKLPSFENVHLYPLMLEVLGLKQLVPTDGRLDHVRASLRPADRAN